MIFHRVSCSRPWNSTAFFPAKNTSHFMEIINEIYGRIRLEARILKMCFFFTWNQRRRREWALILKSSVIFYCGRRDVSGVTGSIRELLSYGFFVGFVWLRRIQWKKQNCNIFVNKDFVGIWVENWFWKITILNWNCP